MLAFGLTISKTLIGSLTSMAAASAAAALQTANVATISLKSLKPNAALGRVYNQVALSEDRRAGALKRMINSLNASIISTKVDATATHQAILAKRQLVTALHLTAIATHKDSAAKALNMIQTHGVSLALEEHMIVMAANRVTTEASVIGQDLYTIALIRARGAVFALSASVKFLGAALLTYMPWIMGIMMAVSILGPMIMSLFTEKEDKLSKQIEKNTERFEKFNDTVAQYTRSIGKATSESDAWYRTLKPIAGLVAQVNAAIKDTALAAETDRIIALAEATKRLAIAEKARDEVIAKGKKDRGKSGYTKGDKELLEFKDAEAAQNKALTISEEDQLIVRNLGIDAIARLIASLDTMHTSLEAEKDTTIMGTDALNILNSTRKSAHEILLALVASTDTSIERTEEAQDAIDKLANSTMTALKAYENFNDIVAKANVLGSTKTFGEFAKEIDNVEEAVNSLNAMMGEGGLGPDAANEKAYEIMKAYGLESRWSDLSSQEVGGPNAMFAENAVDRVKKFKIALNDLNEDFKMMAVWQAQTESLSKLFGADSNFAYQEILDTAQAALNLERRKLTLIKKGGKDEYEQKLRIMELERELLGLTKERMKVLADRAKDSGMGAAATASILGVGTSAAIEASSVTQYDKEGNQIGAAGDFATDIDKEDALAANRAQTAKNTLAGVAEDLAKLGPEGALMSSVIAGTMNMQTAFTTAFEVMGSSSASMSEKVQAGLGAMASMIGAISQMQQASSADKVRAIDEEIAAEKRRDGTSAESVAKLEGLEKKKEKQQRKAFEQQKKMKMASTAISTASGALAAYTSAMESGIPAPYNMVLGAVMAAAIIAMGAKQMAMISSTSFQGGGSAGSAPAKVSMGSRSNTVDLAKGNNAGGELAYMRGESGQGTGATNYKPTGAFAGVRHRAGGGYVVGEQGPEIFMPDVPGQIMSAGESQNAGGSTITANINIQALDAAGVQDVIIGQKGNIISMIRDAANEHGEFFMEGINTDVYSNAQEAM